MNDQIDDDKRIFLRKLNDENQDAAALFEWAAGRRKDANFTNMDRLSWLTETQEWELREVIKLLQDKGLCRFIIGRKGHKSRVEWFFSIRAMAEIARGKDRPLEDVGADVIDEVADVPSSQPIASQDEGLRLTIPQAKQAIAATLGIDPDKVEITIRA